VALAIAGSDSGGGAGIQADLKAFAAVGVHGTTAITAITAQSTVGVDAIHPVPAEIIVAQVVAVAEDIGVDAVKVGMLGTIATIEAVAAALDAVGDAPVVIDPVMVSESGARLLDEEARSALAERLLPRASVVTPNLPEARALLSAGEDVSAVELAAGIRALGPAAVIVTGGHADGADLLDDGGEPLPIPGPCRRRSARLRLHAQLDARRAPRPRVSTSRCGGRGAPSRRRCRRRRPTRRRRRPGAGRCAGDRLAAAASAAAIIGT
jgi:hydroxymethylpyrimidine/phosphomethylpyrimidine kinase